MRRPALILVALAFAASAATASTTVAVVPPPPAAAGSAAAAATPGRPTGAQVTPPFSVSTPPSDAVTTTSGLTYKVITSVAGAPHPGRNDTVQVHYTGWRPDGTTFFTTTTRGKPSPMQLGEAAPGMAEALALLGKGERAMVWIPAAIGYRSTPAAGAEDLAYEIELVDIAPAPAVPPDVAKPPKRAAKLPGKIRSVLVAAGTGGAGPGPADTATFHLTAWDASGVMRETTRMGQAPRTSPIYQLAPGLADALASMHLGDRRRFWIPEPLTTRFGAGGDPRAIICYELELLAIATGTAPPPPPPDVKRPPRSATRTRSGLAYRILTSGTGTVTPTAADTVEVHYTGWTTDGRMFDSSVVRGAPATFALAGVIPGWTEAMQHAVVGDTLRVWIPEALAYKGARGKPAGVLVFDISLLSIK